MLESGYAAPEIATRAQLLVNAVVRECCIEILLRGYQYDGGGRLPTPEDFVKEIKAKFGME